MKEHQQLSLSRREFIQAGAAAAVALPAAALLGTRAARAEEKLVTDMPDQAYMVQALQYVNVSDRPGESCANCQFYTPGEDATGKCTLIPVGLVTEGGSCASYVTKVE